MCFLQVLGSTHPFLWLPHILAKLMSSTLKSKLSSINKWLIAAFRVSKSFFVSNLHASMVTAMPVPKIMEALIFYVISGNILPSTVLHILSNPVEVQYTCEVPLPLWPWNVFHDHKKQRQGRAGHNYTKADLPTFLYFCACHSAYMNVAVWLSGAAMSNEQLWYNRNWGRLWSVWFLYNDAMHMINHSQVCQNTYSPSSGCTLLL